MSDEKKMQITPDAPGWVSVQNPFESPSDFSHLQEQIVSSPSVFKSTKSSVTPGKFRWSIDELALINPVEIDSEDIHRQALFLSHARLDKEMEEKRQQAIEEFFTKSIIVPSPWTNQNGKQVSQLNSTRCIDLNNASPVGREVAVQPGKNNVACQTVLSLPVDFDLEKILGEYFKADELADQSQESLSTSSLRRKLFLDENGSLSENSSPSPQSPRNVPASLGVLCSIDISPVRCRSPLNTSSSGQFSSSPIQGGTRTYSLGSLTSPSVLERSPANVASPTFSPIGIQIRKTPLSEQRQFTFRSPDIPAVSTSCRPTPTSTRCSYSECSPLKNPSPMRLVACRGSTLYQTSLIRLPSTPESVYEEDDDKGATTSFAEIPPPVEAKVNLHHLHGDAFTKSTHLVVAKVSISPEHSESNMQGLTLLHDVDCFKENHTVDMDDPEEMLDENLVKGSSENNGMPMAALSIEGSCMFLSPLAESSASPYESSSIQVDSGYNTQTCTSSLMETAGIETSCRESDMHMYETQNKFHFFKTKQGKSIPRYWIENEPVTHSRSQLTETPLSK
ncbi:protein aurora borealis isoform X2 [Hemicordylus capensis]|nr:protein aurora borealis isoform X2 [Hemicordylus capensis]XP_053166665.1 protein aurora borealis isoform X2 [Hemicordylus capensis]XP_053166667.1 protein aurora borealis isoform X2 [Hemicordylus capensis]XP_053166668.1 protein aurora borealis isoform X2 [Hemicordylus capensis]XP_053166669.1 protein aurora borealis isoform X2 [Hemicordylus capensis]XP_053166670.1 protein aurora borealis isoform X2 [Hemicordylus capensis]